ncbi:MAG: inorganic phosphate transporter [Candidatus Caldarchaeales archaeon]
MEEAEAFTIAIFISFLFSWNNSSLFIGGLTSSGIVKLRIAALFTALSMIIGFSAESQKMDPENILLYDGYHSPLITILIMLAISNLLSIPISISSISIASLIGSSIASGSRLNIVFLSITVLAWLLAPLSSMLLTSIIYNILRKRFSSIKIDSLPLLNKVIIYSTTFYAAYVISANNLGFLISMLDNDSTITYVTTFLGIVLGSYFFSERISYIMGERLAILSPVKLSSSLLSSSIILWILTQFSIPSALTHIILGGFIGAASASPSSIINMRLFKNLTRSWIITTLISIPLSYILRSIMR